MATGALRGPGVRQSAVMTVSGPGRGEQSARSASVSSGPELLSYTARIDPASPMAMVQPIAIESAADNVRSFTASNGIATYDVQTAESVSDASLFPDPIPTFQFGASAAEFDEGVIVRLVSPTNEPENDYIVAHGAGGVVWVSPTELRLETSAPIDGHITVETPYIIEGTVAPAIRFIVFTLTEAIHHNSLGYALAIISSLRLHAASGGPDIALGATVTPATTLNGYIATGLNDGDDATNWGNGGAPPTAVTIDLGAGNEIANLDSYSIRIASDNGNAPYYPTGWTIETGESLGSLTLVDTKTAETFVTAGQENVYTL